VLQVSRHLSVATNHISFRSFDETTMRYIELDEK
jgi:hypothetical protein